MICTKTRVALPVLIAVAIGAVACEQLVDVNRDLIPEDEVAEEAPPAEPAKDASAGDATEPGRDIDASEPAPDAASDG
ncbi:hypothetical protein AKJ09_03644 [Labilithrix luteola]|uniref:Lipoprotein n=1 Tax=Labilithrix luteola TaxID=1391654 RepID=A0A0K1PTX0_9BACT|nr:hypothetical protein [Labilithrix luteola]AKU96980.1 hypothetical protein AKJ09_03644 [Labilithrix luteola]